MDLKYIAEGGSFDLVQAIRLLAVKVDALTSDNPALATMDAADAGATLDEASAGGASATGSAKKPAGKKKATEVAMATEAAEAAEVVEDGE